MAKDDELEEELDTEDVEDTEEDDEADLDEDLDEESEESLEVLLGTDGEEEPEEVPRARRPAKAATPISEGEFTCRSCFLVKSRAQLADAKRQICLDCA